MEQFFADLMNSVLVDALSELISMGIVSLVCALFGLFAKKRNK